MSQDEAFLQAIVASPEDAALRLIYADWLQEGGDPRADFLRQLHQRDEATARLEQLIPGLDPEWVRRVCGGRVGNIQMLPTPTRLPRVETGAVQFGNDWPGFFLRGDTAFHLSGRIRQLAERLADHPDPDVVDLLRILTGYADMIEQDVIV